MDFDAVSRGEGADAVDGEKARCRSDADCRGARPADGCDEGVCRDPEQTDEAERECSEAADCAGPSPTKACREGVCEDPSWGCVGEADDRPAAESVVVTLQLLALDVYRRPVPGLVVKVCDPPWIDPDCKRQNPNMRTQYDDETGEITVEGPLADTKSYRISIEPPKGATVVGSSGERARILPLDYYSQRTLRGTIDERDYPLPVLDESLLRALARQVRPEQSVDLDEAAALIARIFDCRGDTIPGVSIELAPRQSEAITAYINEAGVASATQATRDPGLAGIVNVSVGRSTELVESAGDLVISRFEFTPRPGRITFVSLYPRVYAQTQ